MRGALRRLARQALALVRRGPLDRDLDDELASHLTLAEDEHVRRGLMPDEARRLARLEFGSYDAAVERHREARGLPSLDALWQDLRYAFRSLRREPAFALVSVVILALGIGANTAVFSIVNALVLRPLPFPESDRLLWITKADESDGLSGQTYPVAVYEAFRRENHSLDEVTAYFAFFGFNDFTLESGQAVEHIGAVQVAPRFFEVLGVEPARGRRFAPEEERPNGPAVALISDALWHRAFAADPAIVGRTVSVSHSPLTVVGVLPAEFDFGAVFSPGSRVDMFVPAPLDQMKNWGNTLAIIGRLKPGSAVSEAEREFDALGPRIERLQPALTGRTHAEVSSLKAHVSGRMRPLLIVLWTAVGFVLLIVCANLASLLLARTSARTREIAVRMALGAGRVRLLRQLMAEGVILSVTGAAAGIPLAYVLTRYLKSSAITSIPLLTSVQVDGASMAATIVIATVTGIVIGAVPGLRITRGGLSNALKEQSRGSTDGSWHRRLRASLVVGEIALACVLLVGAGLLMRSLLALMQEDFGFQPEHVMHVRIDVPQGLAADRITVFKDDVTERAREVPGVDRAGLTDALPLDRNRQWDLRRAEDPAHGDIAVSLYVVGPGYLGAMGIPVKSGRDFSAADRAKTLQVAILSESAAEALWPGRLAIGRHITTDIEREVIAVVPDVRQTSLEQPRAAQCYLPYTQADGVALDLVVRTRLAPETVAGGIRSALMPMAPGISTAEFRPVDQLVERATSPRRFLLSLVGGFSLMSLVLACLGIYGLVAYNVAQRRQEIGLRMALGATALTVSLDVMRETARLALVGVALGAAGSLGLARLIASLLFHTSPSDPAAFTSAAIALVLVALAAGLLPAISAARVEPMAALRTE